MSWGRRRCGGDDEWEATRLVSVRVAPWTSARVVNRFAAGRVVCGLRLSDQWIELYLGGYVEASGLRSTGRRGHADRSRTATFASVAELEAVACAKWIVVYSEGAVAVRSEPSRESPSVSAVGPGGIVCGALKDGWVAFSKGGFVATKTKEHGYLLRRAPSVDEDIELSVDDVGTKVTVRTTTTAQGLVEALRRALPVPADAVVLVEASGMSVAAPADASAWELGYRTSGQRLRWSCESPYDKDLELRLTASHGGATRLPGVVVVKASDTLGRVIEKLCAANPPLRAECVIFAIKPGSRVARADVVEDNEKAWAAGVRDTFHFVYLGDLPPLNNEDNINKNEEARDELTARDLKARADVAFREGRFDDAVVAYTRSLAACGDGDEDVALGVRSNRAAAHKQLGDSVAVVEDSAAVLALKPNDVKSRLRRAEALEALEDFAAALEDVEAVLALRHGTDGQHLVGDANASRCLAAKSRLRRRSARKQRPKRRVQDGVVFPEACLVERGCGYAGRRQTDPHDGRTFQHKATLIFLVSNDATDVADRLDRSLRRDFPELKILVVKPTPQRLAVDWFELPGDEWAGMLLVETRDDSRKSRLLAAQIDESVASVAGLVERELRLVDGSYLAVAGVEQGAVVATHLAVSRAFSTPLGALVALNGPTPLPAKLLDDAEPTNTANLHAWIVHGSHHDRFPLDVSEAHARLLQPRFECFATQAVPYGHDELSPADYEYLATIFSFTVGPFRHADLKKTLEELTQHHVARMLERSRRDSSSSAAPTRNQTSKVHASRKSRATAPSAANNTADKPRAFN